jgi:predicted 3-demethylubiquinone-9 3-methyltransferase (glyoxalase superfamily)
MATTANPKICTFLWYPTQAEEAAKLYTSIFPDSRVNGVWALPAESPSGPPGSVKVVDFTLFGQPFQAMTAGAHHEFNDAISIVVQCEDQAEVDRYWNALLENGGQPQACGWITDKFGLRWQIVPRVLFDMMRSDDKVRGRRAAEAMLNMIKLDVAELKKAYGA